MSAGAQKEISAKRKNLLGEDVAGDFAVARFVRATPQKVRRVADLVRGKSVDDALTALQFAPQAAAENVYKVVFCGFTILGSGLALNAVLGFSDAAIFLMAIPNVIGLYLLARVLKGELSQYREKVRTGEFARVK